ncbi:MAG: hypothetical protein SPL80_04275 [Bacilli bacterium]|nr:hypothetical protein [Bacilli bacterium]
MLNSVMDLDSSLFSLQSVNKYTLGASDIRSDVNNKLVRAKILHDWAMSQPLSELTLHEAVGRIRPATRSPKITIRSMKAFSFDFFVMVLPPTQRKGEIIYGRKNQSFLGD